MHSVILCLLLSPLHGLLFHIRLHKTQNHLPFSAFLHGSDYSQQPDADICCQISQQAVNIVCPHCGLFDEILSI
jgi:hypothetical protein